LQALAIPTRFHDGDSDGGRNSSPQKKDSQSNVSPLYFNWRPQPDLNRCCRRERPSRSVFRLISLPFSTVKIRLREIKAVKKAVNRSILIYRICPSIHPITKYTKNPISSSVSALPFSILYHFFRHPRQHVAVACCAMKTGCPFIGVCFPSFLGLGGAKRDVMKSAAWDRIVVIPLSLIYWRSLSVNLNRDLNFEFLSAVSAVITWSVVELV